MYIAGFVIPVPADKMEAYQQWAERGSAIFKAYGFLPLNPASSALSPPAPGTAD